MKTARSLGLLSALFLATSSWSLASFAGTSSSTDLPDDVRLVLTCKSVIISNVVAEVYQHGDGQTAELYGRVRLQPLYATNGQVTIPGFNLVTALAKYDANYPAPGFALLSEPRGQFALFAPSAAGTSAFAAKLVATSDIPTGQFGSGSYAVDVNCMAH